MNIRVVHPDGSTDNLTFIRSKELYKFENQDQASVYTRREDVNSITITEAEDEVFIEDGGTDLFGGLLTDIIRGGSEVELLVDSFEQYARDAEPTAADNQYSNADDSVPINDAISSVSELSAGTVNTVDSAISLLFSHASQAHKMRKVEQITDGELRFNTDKTVDYVDKLGSDKTATTLSPSSQNIIGDIEVARISGEEKVTHLRAIGTGEGIHQLTSEVVASNYSSGDRKIWRTYINKGINNQDALDNWANTLISELNTEFIEVDTSVKGVDVVLGDEFTVDYPDENINTQVLRAVEVERIIDSAGKRYSVTFSSRQKTRKDPDKKQREDSQRYNLAVQGNAVPINASGGRQPVNSSINYEMKLYYPSEVVFEHRLNVRVNSLPYRAYSSGGGSSSGSSSTTGTENNTITDLMGTSQLSSDVTLTPGDEQTILTFTTPSDYNEYFFIMAIQLITNDPNSSGTYSTSFEMELDSFDTGSLAEGRFESEDITGNWELWVPITDIGTGIDVDLEIRNPSTKSDDLIIDENSDITAYQPEHEHTFNPPDHTHPTDPGVSEFGSETPSNVDVIINGNTVASDIGSGTFETAVDVTGKLTAGQINVIEVSSDSLGHIQAFVEGDVYRQILGTG